MTADLKQTEAEQITALRASGCAVRFIENPSEAVRSLMPTSLGSTANFSTNRP